MPKSNQFAVLRELREQRQGEAKKKNKRTVKKSKVKKVNKQIETETTTPPALAQEAQPKKGPGRPPGRRSNPAYTQISAYVPLDLILSVQETLAQEQRQQKQRTARPVSDLVEELLQNWLKKRHREMSQP